MAHTLFVIQGSHPCATVERAFELKGVPFRRIEMPPPAQVVVQRAVFGGRTVPGWRLPDGEKVQGSRAIVRRLEQIAPEPPLFPADPDERARVEAAEAWGEQTYQPVPRRLLWRAFAASPRSMPSFQAASRLPTFPPAVAAVVGPAITRIERRLNAATDARVDADLRELPAHLDRIDALLAEGVIGAARPNAADLQIGSTTRLLLAMDDLAPLLAGRPAREHALRLFPAAPGHVPSGALAMP